MLPRGPLLGTSVLLMFWYNSVGGKTLHSYAGPWFATTRRFETCESSGTYKMELKGSHYNPAKPFETQTLTGHIYMQKDWTDEEWALVRMAVRSNNQWKENAFIFKFPRGACTTMRTHLPDFHHLVAKVSNAPMLNNPNAPCMVPMGNWTVQNEPVSWTFPKFQIMPYGRYRFTLTFGRNQTTEFCNNVECDIMPKPM